VRSEVVEWRALSTLGETEEKGPGQRKSLHQSLLHHLKHVALMLHRVTEGQLSLAPGRGPLLPAPSPPQLPG
jgi:hypothetical protein